MKSTNVTPTLSMPSLATPLRILWASNVDPDPNSGAGGTELETIAAIRELGHHVDEIWAHDLPRRVRHGNLHSVMELPWTYRHAILEHCKRTTYDVVNVNLGQSYLAGRTLKAMNFPGVFVVRSHGLDDHLNETLAHWTRRLGLPERPVWKRLPGEYLNRIIAGHLKQAAQVCDGYIVSNSLDSAHLQQRHGLAADRIACLPQAPPAGFVSGPAPEMTPHRLQRVLYVAGFHFAKGPHAVAQAANQLLRRDTDYHLTWLCKDEDHSKVRALLEPHARERIDLRGWTTQEKLIELFDDHGIFLYPTLFDGFGKVFLEAMSRGLVVIGTRAGGMVDLLEDQANGVHVDFNAPQQMVAAVQELNADPAKARKLSAAAAETARQHSWHRVGSETIDFFRYLQAMKTREATDSFSQQCQPAHG